MERDLSFLDIASSQEECGVVLSAFSFENKNCVRGAGQSESAANGVDRVSGIHRRIKWMHDETLDQLGLTVSDWHVLTALRWAGAPYRRKAGELARRADLTSGAMTSRLDALEKEGLVRRLPDPADRRGVLVELTEKGREQHQQAMGIQAEKEALLAAALTAREKEQLNSLLRRVMLTLEDRYPGKPD